MRVVSPEKEVWKTHHHGFVAVEEGLQCSYCVFYMKNEGIICGYL